MLKPQAHVLYAMRPRGEPEVWHIAMRDEPNDREESAEFLFDARTGELLHEYRLKQGPLHWLLVTHTELFAGLPGTLFLGFMGLLFVVSLH